MLLSIFYTHFKGTDWIGRHAMVLLPKPFQINVSQIPSQN